MNYKKIDEVSKEFWETDVLEDNKILIEEFLQQAHLSPKTLKQYESALKIFSKWVHDNCLPKGKKPIYELKPRDALKFQNWLIGKGLSNNSVKFKRSAVSSLCGYIELYYADEYKDFRNIYTKSIPNVEKKNSKIKEPITASELKKLIKVLKKNEDWQKLSYLLFTYITGCRREESRQLLVEVANYSKHKDRDGNEKSYYITHPIRAKGKGTDGNVRKFKFDEEAMKYIKLWIDYRKSQFENDDCPYVFVSRTKNGYKQVSPNAFNLWCEEFSEILGKHVHPHLFRSSRATNSVIEEGKSIASVQKLLGHSSSQTTEIYIVRNDEDDDDELFD